MARRLDLPLQPAEKQLLLEVARAIGASEPLQPAARLFKDRNQDERVRTLAAELLEQLGTAEDLAPLSQWILTVEDAAEDLAVAGLIPTLHEKGLWEFETAAVFALSLVEKGQWLQHHLAQNLSLERARWLTRKYLAQEPDRHSEPLLKEALQTILAQQLLEPADRAYLIPLVLSGHIESWPREQQMHLLRAFQRDVTSRRDLLLEKLRRHPEDQDEGSWRWFFILQSEDLRWLLDLVRDLQSLPPWLLQVLYSLSYRPEIGRQLRNRSRQEIRTRDPEQLARFDRARREHRQMEARWEALEKKTVVQVYELEALVRDALESQDLKLCGKMLRFSWSCFTKASARPTNVSGHWEDLPEVLQQQVLGVSREALVKCAPTRIPDGSSFPTSILWEGACFHHLVSGDEIFVLKSQVVRSWLPSLLRGWEHEWESTLRRCFEVDRPSTEEIFLEAILREVRQGDSSSYLAQELPLDLWSDRLAAHLEEEIIEVESNGPAIRIYLLGRIARVFPDRAKAIALRWANSTTSGEETRLLQEAGIDLLLQVAPEEGWPRLKSLLEQEEPAKVLVRMRSLLPHYSGPTAELATWPTPLLGELADQLSRAFPEASDPVRQPGQAYDLDAEHDLRSLRGTVPALLFRRDQEGDSRVLEQLATRWSEVHRWLDQTLAQQGAEGVLAGIGREALPTIGTAEAVPLLQMVRLLVDERYRLVRTAGDLQSVILEVLRAIASDAKEHLAMLYRPSERGGQRRGHLHEEALQAYICCRLRDRLVPGVLDRRTLVFVDREPLAAQNQRNDVKVQAVSIQNKPVQVIIEIKWSDNKGVSISQTEQLAKDYLGKTGLTHGIYLVGWCGQAGAWKSGALGQAPSKRKSLEAWQGALENQAAALREQHSELYVEPLVLDLCWS